MIRITTLSRFYNIYIYIRKYWDNIRNHGKHNGNYNIVYMSARRMIELVAAVCRGSAACWWNCSDR